MTHLMIILDFVMNQKKSWMLQIWAWMGACLINDVLSLARTWLQKVAEGIVVRLSLLWTQTEAVNSRPPAEQLLNSGPRRYVCIS